MRLLDELGKQIGILDRNSALRRAQAEEKDLVEIAPKANPPVVKLIDYKKFKYLEAKKERESRRNIKNVSVKEIRIKPFIADHDFKTRISQAQEFLKAGNQLKISVPFRGRQIAHKEFGFNVLKRAIEALANISKIVKPAHFEGKVLVAILTPQKYEKNENQKNSTQTV